MRLQGLRCYAVVIGVSSATVSEAAGTDDAESARSVGEVAGECLLAERCASSIEKKRYLDAKATRTDVKKSFVPVAISAFTYPTRVESHVLRPGQSAMT